MNKRRRRIQKHNRRLRKCEAAIQRSCRRTILNTLNGRATITGDEQPREPPRRLVMVPPNSETLAASLRTTAGKTVGIVKQGEEMARTVVFHGASLALRFDPSVNGQWRVTIEKNRWGSYGFSMRVALYAGQWFAA